jgi:N-acetylmuramoyl-L-alanine amidase
MKIFLAWMLLLLAAGNATLPAAVINGQDYVALTGWARDNALHVVSQTRGQIVLAGKNARLVFNADSADATVNGVNLRLSFPVANDHGRFLIAQFDLNSAVEPLLFPSRYVDYDRIRTICLDPGHGGRDTGNRVWHFYWHNEKTYTLLLAEELRDQLRRAGFRVILTRSRDVYVDLAERPAIANQAGADLFISLHFNAAPADAKSVQGIETYCITPVGAPSSNAQGEGSHHPPTPANRWERRSLLFAYEMQKALVQNLHAEDRGVRRARFAVLRDARMPAILIEGGYMTNPEEGRKIFDPAYRKQMAAAIVKGILAYARSCAPPSASK